MSRMAVYGTSIESMPFVVCDRKIYWKNGTVEDYDGDPWSICLRGLSYADYIPPHHRFHEWSDAKRDAVKAVFARKRAKWEKEQQDKDEKLSKLMKAARAKLTEEEFDAVFYAGRDNRTELIP